VCQNLGGKVAAKMGKVKHNKFLSKWTAFNLKFFAVFQKAPQELVRIQSRQINLQKEMEAKSTGERDTDLKKSCM
jgi:hypothetical protein